MALESNSLMPSADELKISRLGDYRYPAPARPTRKPYVDDSERVLLPSDSAVVEPYLSTGEMPPSFERAGPRSRIFFEPAELGCGIVTCGGLCPGLNNVVRSIVLVIGADLLVTALFYLRG